MNKIKIAVALAIVVLLFVLASINLNNADNEIKSDSPIEKENNNMEEKPRFEAVFAVVGLIAIAYLAQRQKE